MFENIGLEGRRFSHKFDFVEFLIVDDLLKATEVAFWESDFDGRMFFMVLLVEDFTDLVKPGDRFAIG